MRNRSREALAPAPASAVEPAVETAPAGPLRRGRQARLGPSSRPRRLLCEPAERDPRSAATGCRPRRTCRRATAGVVGSGADLARVVSLGLGFALVSKLTR